MNKSKVSLAVSAIIEKVEMIAGLCWGGFWTLGVLIYIFDDDLFDMSLVIISLLLAVLGFWVFSLGQKRAKMRKEFKKYVTQLSVDPSGSLENMAAATGTSVDVLKKNLQFMIKKKFFTDAFINEQANQLVLPSMVQRAQQQAQNFQYATPGAAQQELVACTCPCCGGMNKIAKGKTAECDFCGSPLQG